jgi:hypothetical protein
MSTENKPNDTTAHEKVIDISRGLGFEHTRNIDQLPEEPINEKMTDKEVEELGKWISTIDKGKTLS